MGDAASLASAAEMVGRAVGEVREALNEHADVVAELFGRVSSDLRSGFRPALDSFLGFFHAVDWKVGFFLIAFLPPICPGSTWDLTSHFNLLLLNHQVIK